MIGTSQHDHIVGQVLIHAAETVGGPGAHRRTTRDLIARTEEGNRRIVIDGLGVISFSIACRAEVFDVAHEGDPSGFFF